jgi:hypothetical protein
MAQPDEAIQTFFFSLSLAQQQWNLSRLPRRYAPRNDALIVFHQHALAWVNMVKAKTCSNSLF